MQKRIGAGSILALVGAVGLLAMTSPAHADLTNGDFETGNFTGWTLVKQGAPPTGSNDSGVYTTFTGAPASGHPIVHTAENGSDFFLLRAGFGPGTNVYSTISQDFTAGQGQTLSGFAFFQANGILANNDDAYVDILQNGKILFSSSVDTIGQNNSTPWTGFSYDFTGLATTYTIQAGVRNGTTTTDPSSLGLDNVSLGITSHALTTPEGSSLFLLIAGGLPFAAVPLIRRKRK